MGEVVKVSSVDTIEKLIAVIEENFKNNRFSQITQAIGIYSILIDAENARTTQRSAYSAVLAMIKKRMAAKVDKKYAAWYADFHKTMDELIFSSKSDIDPSARAVLSSHRNASGPFRSVEDFFFWGLDDRRLTLEQIVNLIEKTSDSYA